MFGWDFEVDTCSRFWRWNMIKICVITCNLNSTLGSIVPLAMLIIFHYLILPRVPTSGKHILCPSSLPEKGRNTVGSEQACQVAVYDQVLVYHGLCLCWVGASLPCCSLCLCLSWGALMLDRSKLDRLNYSSTILGEGSPNYIKTFIISSTYHFIQARPEMERRLKNKREFHWSGQGLFRGF